MPYGFSWMRYQSDDGRTYALKVDNDYVDDGRRGWSAVAEPGDIQYPRAWHPRAVYGVAGDGSVRYAICATIAAPLWSGLERYFYIRDSSGALVNVYVFGKRAERIINIRPVGTSLAMDVAQSLLEIVKP